VYKYCTPCSVVVVQYHVSSAMTMYLVLFYDHDHHVYRAQEETKKEIYKERNKEEG